MQKTNNEFVEGRSCQRPRLRGHEGGEPEAKKKGEGCFRFCRRGSTVNEEERGSRKKAIRLKCLDCCCGSAYEVRLCPGQTVSALAVPSGDGVQGGIHRKCRGFSGKLLGQVSTRGQGGSQVNTPGLRGLYDDWGGTEVCRKAPGGGDPA